ncbi:SH3 domain-containing protein [Microvirga ossetica]|uniref:SH3 domain-containing protein n=1 Tax=Microvirga ossetica TaxID=1882682 RepID=UPI001F4093FE|nr:SH3 domain-containing protein [Microvirga ossetica]
MPRISVFLTLLVLVGAFVPTYSARSQSGGIHLFDPLIREMIQQGIQNDRQRTRQPIAPSGPVTISSTLTKVTDSRTGIEIRLPTHILIKEGVSQNGGSRWQTFDDRITVDTVRNSNTSNLRQIYENITRIRPNVQINHSKFEADSFVIVGETPKGKFLQTYTAGPEEIRGLLISYEKELASYFDRTAGAIIDSFIPFPDGIAVVVGGDFNNPACPSTGVVSRLKPQTESFLSVRSGPGVSHREVDRLTNGSPVAICQQTDSWFAVVYSTQQGTNDCNVQTPSPAKRSYTGPCKYGWVHSSYIGNIRMQQRPSSEPLKHPEDIKVVEASQKTDLPQMQPPSTASAATATAPSAPIPRLPVVPKDCPARSPDYSSRLALIKTHVKIAHEQVEEWKSLRKIAEKAQQSDIGAFCKAYLDPMKKALEAMNSFMQKNNEGLVLDSFNACVETQATKIEKEVDNVKGSAEPVGLLLKIHADLIRIKIENVSLIHEHKDYLGTVESIKGSFASSTKQCSL